MELMTSWPGNPTGRQIPVRHRTLRSRSGGGGRNSRPRMVTRFKKCQRSWYKMSSQIFQYYYAAKYIFYIFVLKCHTLPFMQVCKFGTFHKGRNRSVFKSSNSIDFYISQFCRGVFFWLRWLLGLEFKVMSFLSLAQARSWPPRRLLPSRAYRRLEHWGTCPALQLSHPWLLRTGSQFRSQDSSPTPFDHHYFPMLSGNISNWFGNEEQSLYTLPDLPEQIQQGNWANCRPRCSC